MNQTLTPPITAQELIARFQRNGFQEFFELKNGSCKGKNKSTAFG